MIDRLDGLPLSFRRGFFVGFFSELKGLLNFQDNIFLEAHGILPL